MLENLTPTCKVRGTLEAGLQLAETGEFNSWSVFIKVEPESQWGGPEIKTYAHCHCPKQKHMQVL